METDLARRNDARLRNSPHSLGKLIEWKLSIFRHHSLRGKAPHSLGKLIEWKLVSFSAFIAEKNLSNSPHSLGKLIEWKQSFTISV